MAGLLHPARHASSGRPGTLRANPRSRLWTGSTYPSSSEITCPFDPIVAGRPARFRKVVSGEAELVVERHEQVLGPDGSVLGDLAPGVRRADDPAAGEAAAGDQDAHHLAPVVAAGDRVGARDARLVDPGRPAELAHDDHDRRVEQPAARRGRRPGVPTAASRTGRTRLHPLFEAGMEVPAAEGQGDEPDARLDQPAGHQGALAPLVAAVAVAEPGALPCGCRTPRGRRGSVTIAKASWPNRSRPSIRPEASTSRRALSKACEQAAAAVEPRRRRRPAGRREVGDPVAVGVRVAVGRERVVGRRPR